MSLPTGAEIEPARGATGRGELTIDNGTASDAVVKVLAEGSRRFVYVRAGERFTVTALSTGTYVVAFMTGHDWDPTRRTFRRDRASFRFAESLEFRELQRAGELLYDTYKLTLHRVPRGNAPARQIDDKQFEAL